MGAVKYAITKENKADVNREQSYIQKQKHSISEIMTNVLFCLKVENTQAINYYVWEKIKSNVKLIIFDY